MNLIVSTEEARKNFYPTPDRLADKLLEGLDFFSMKTVLEPSVGSGTLLIAIARRMYKRYLDLLNERHGFRIDYPNLKVEMVEIDPALRGIVTEKFMSDEKDYWKQARELDKGEMITDCGADEKERIRAMAYFTDSTEFMFVHNDFLKFETFMKYDLIVMNPPFDKGDEHLLHAIRMQKRYGGKIRCILNAETIKNPCTAKRKLLRKTLDELNADVDFYENEFSKADRKTDVTVAVIKIDIPYDPGESEFYEHFKKAEDHFVDKESTKDLAPADAIEAILAQYRVEVNAGIALIKEYQALSPFILDSFDAKQTHRSPILELRVRGKELTCNAYVKRVRLKYWEALFHNEELFGKLTTNLSNELHSRIKDMEEYEFDIYNINLLVKNMNAKLAEGIKETILALFEKLTSHNWRRGEDCENVHYYNGWSTNKAHCINKKVIIPCYEIFKDRRWYSELLDEYNAVSLLSDIEKSLNYLDGNMTEPVSLQAVIHNANICNRSRNISCKFFDVTFYKKGTCHIKFTNQELLDRFNIFCSREKNWLPPSYGRKHYKDMAEDERAVVDSFHKAAGAENAEAAYEHVMENASYYLASPVETDSIKFIGSGE